MNGIHPQIFYILLEPTLNLIPEYHFGLDFWDPAQQFPIKEGSGRCYSNFQLACPSPGRPRLYGAHGEMKDEHSSANACCTLRLGCSHFLTSVKKHEL